MPDHSRSPARALLISVGGSPNPVLYSINQHRPDYVWFFCSADSCTQAETLYLDLVRAHPDWRLTAEYLVVERFEELGPCFEKLRTSIPGLLSKWHVAPEHVCVDYTGGTKTMSAALVLAGVEFLDRFSYIGGEQREKEGLGVTIDGKERVFYQQNPWASLAIREVERARDLWAASHFDAAADTLASAAARVPQKRLFETLATVARGLAARHRLDFKEAAQQLGRAAKSLPNLLDGKPDHGLLSFVEGAAKRSGLCVQSGPDFQQHLLGELLDNTVRTATQHRFEDAAARLYRSMEMQLQMWLEAKTGGHFKNGECKNIPDPWPPGLEALRHLKPHPEGSLKLGLEAMIGALQLLDAPQVARMAADLATAHPRLRDVTKTRNLGILAHGTTAVGSEGFERFKSVATEFFGFDLTRERNPIPPLDPRWLQFHTP